MNSMNASVSFASMVLHLFDGRSPALARSDGGYAERVGESGGRGEALDAARARLRALVAEGGVAGGAGGRAPPI